MVSGKRTTLVLGVFVRILLLIIALGLGGFTSFPFHAFILDTLNFKNPSDFFGASWADWGLAWTLTSLFWSGIVFGALGKKIDYIFIAIIFLFSLLIFFYTKNVTLAIYLGLVGVAVLGNVLGYMLKVGRQTWFGR